LRNFWFIAGCPASANGAIGAGEHANAGHFPRAFWSARLETAAAGTGGCRRIQSTLTAISFAGRGFS
jgi:hypothetical protein